MFSVFISLAWREVDVYDSKTKTKRKQNQTDAFFSIFFAIISGQVLARLFEIITQASALDQINSYALADPIGSTSFASAEVKVGLASAILLISFGAFAQCARLSVHLSFMFRVAPCAENRDLGLPLRNELIAMTHRVSV